MLIVHGECTEEVPLCRDFIGKTYDFSSRRMIRWVLRGKGGDGDNHSLEIHG